MYVYCADTYCDSCGAALISALWRGTGADFVPTYPDDSDHWPQSALEEATDSPDHCGRGAACLEAVDLADYGLAATDWLFGAEERKIGALLSDGLTEDGTRYLLELMTPDRLHYSRGIGTGAVHERTLTPYQRALHTYWREVFADELAEVTA